MDSRTIIRKLRDAGWVHFRTTGSHHHCTHPEKPEVIPIATIKSIERQSGVQLKRK